MSVVFRNRGLMNLVAATTFGVNVKENTNPIGYFGTGFKYAVAVCLRMHAHVHLRIGGENYEFVTGGERVRGKDFELVWLRHPDGTMQRLGFTTELGKNWQAWQAYREYLCNAHDEGGDAYDTEDEARADSPWGESECTTITVVGDVLDDAHRNRNEIVLRGEPQWKNVAVHVYDRPSKHVYYRGIRVHDLEHPALFTYNVQANINLTEDRTAAYAFQIKEAIRDACLTSTDPEFVKRFVGADDGTAEQKTELNTMWEPSPVFLETVAALPFMKVTNASARKALHYHTRKHLEPDPTPLNSVEQKMLDKAVAFANYLGYEITPGEIVCTANLPENTLGMMYNGQIYIARSAFAAGTKMVAGTIIEEFIHKKYELADCTRALQNHLLNALVSAGERCQGEPL
jgi:hypothetical protein